MLLNKLVNELERSQKGLAFDLLNTIMILDNTKAALAKLRKEHEFVGVVSCVYAK